MATTLHRTSTRLWWNLRSKEPDDYVAELPTNRREGILHSPMMPGTGTTRAGGNRQRGDKEI
jgi:hypothetical protein